ncbi:MAG: 2-succinyl-5-enolpyruvyl-6-hydroxy-3-cyclohexene-1-carboxylic-acid synthase [Chloroflexi bacterium]|nr:2-succinyl-5-enolpyruvyl-6-hydroxy-3-cyclohexene-1-carboxylic-acid synthase [Chloroflexota bacterium]
MPPHDKQIKIFLEQLLSFSINDIVISPGSRSTPLVNNLLKNKELFNLNLVLDERSAGFFALGKSKISKKPTILICTSGTSTLNYSPAIAEAYFSQVPIIVITADRPMIYRETGSNQTLNQTNIYSNNIKWFYDIPVINDDNFISNVAYKAIYYSNFPTKGPVHINWQFEEPFTDLSTPEINPKITYKTLSSTKINISDERTKNIIPILSDKKGLIIVGSHNYDNKDILNLSEILNWPIIADPLSNLRDEKNYTTPIVDSGDLIFRKEDFLLPETIIHIGNLPVSKFISKNLEKVSNHIFIENSGNISSGFSSIDEHLNISILSLVTQLQKQDFKAINNDWKNTYIKLNDSARKIIDRNISKIKEISTKKTILDSIPEDSIFISGNSLPIRILDLILSKSKNIKFYGNRGLSGIDGNISIASGISSMTKKNVFLDIGDLAFFHDLGGLVTAKRNSKSLTIFVNENSGGQIFSLLPQSKDLGEDYNDWFITPHKEINISGISNSLSIEYYNPKSDKEIKKIINENSENNVKIIEINYDKSDYKIYNQYINNLVQKISIDE